MSAEKRTVMHRVEAPRSAELGLWWVDYGLRYLPGNRVSYFSVTAGCHDSNHKGPCGAAHEKILEAFPDFADIIAMHLSDYDGVPMYAVENGWYHLRHQGVEYAAEYLRCDPAQLKRFVRYADRERPVPSFVKFIDTMRLTWAEEAYALRDKYNLV